MQEVFGTTEQLEERLRKRISAQTQSLPSEAGIIINKQESQLSTTNSRQPLTDGWLKKGPAMWAELHRWALQGAGIEGQAWLDRFSKGIPCGDCRRHWAGLLKELPPDFSSANSLFAWTVQAHNAVNRRLDKPEISLELALNRWKDEPVGRVSSPGARIVRAVLSRNGSKGPPRPVAVSDVRIDCAHATTDDRSTFVKCSLGLYGGRPHVAICGQCRQRCRTGLVKGSPIHDVRKRTFPRSHETPPALIADRGQRPTHRVESSNAERLILRSFLSPGDIVMLTATVRDLHRAHPGRFQTAVETSASELWQHSPLVSAIDRSRGSWRSVEMHYPSINQSNQRPAHFIEGYTQYLATQLKVTIPVTEFRGDIYLSNEEKQWTNQVEEQFGYRGRYWIMIAGGKYDFTTKWWAPASYQKVVDHFQGRLQFVQCGEKGHWHPEMKGAFNLVGKTSIRQFIRLMYHAEGVVCPVTFAMHLAAAVPTKSNRLRPCVVIAGGREPPHWEAYPGHQFLHTIGCLPCCERGGCWKSRCQQISDGDSKDRVNMCERPVQVDRDLRIPQCMAMVQPADVIRAIERALVYAS